MASQPTRKIFRFEVFDVDVAGAELRKSGRPLHLQEQPFQVLVILLESRGEIVSREELRQKLWPADTFVDFNHSLNTIINKLREVLGDSASNPRFIQTLAKRGYRFLPPVDSVNHQSEGEDPLIIAGIRTGDASTSDESAFRETTEPPSPSFLTSIEELPAVPHGYVRVLFLLIQIMYLGFYIAALAKLPRVERIMEQVFGCPAWVTVVLIVSAAVGIPIRLYLLSAISFDVKDLSRKFLRIFPATFMLDELWTLAPFLLAPQIGLGLALAVTAALIYVPFAQRTLLLMRDRPATV